MTEQAPRLQLGGARMRWLGGARTRFIDLALVFGALGLGTYLVSTAGGPTSEEVLARERNLFSTFEPEAIRNITLKSRGTSIQLRKVADDPDPHLYFLGEQGHMPADPAVIAELFSTLEYATWSRTLSAENARDLKKLGFESPRLELSIDAGARSFRLLLGDAAAFPEKSLYARVQDENGHAITGVVGGDLLGKLQRGEQEFRGSALFLYGRSETSSLEIVREGTELRLRADALGFLSEESSPAGVEKIRAERELSDIIFFQMARASISTFVDPVLAKSLISNDAHRLTVIQESSDAPRVSVQFGGTCPDDKASTVALRSTPDIVAGCVPRTILAALRVSKESIRAKEAVPLHADEIDHVIIREKVPSMKRESKLDLIRSEDAFSLLSHASERVELAAGQEFLEVLSSGVLDLVESPPGGLKLTGEIVVKGQSLPSGAQSAEAADSPPTTPPIDENDPLVQELHLELYRSETSEAGAGVTPLWIHRQDDGAWLKVPEPLEWAFSANDAWAKDRHLLQIEPTEILKVSVKGASGWSQSLRPGEMLVESASQPAIPADPLLTRRLLDTLAHLEAVRFLTTAAPQQSAELEVTFSLRAEGQKFEPNGAEKKLWIGKRTRGGYLAWANFVEGSFVLDLGSRSLFNEPWGSRADLQIDVASVVRLSAVADDRTYLFERRGDSLRPSGGAAVEDMVAPLEEAIAALNVIARTMSHPEARRLNRGASQLSLQLEFDSGKKFTLHIGNPGEWQGMNVHVAWREGEEENYVIGKSSLDALLTLL